MTTTVPSADSTRPRAGVRAWVRDHGLTLVLLGVFLLTLFGHAWFGWLDDNQDRRQHGGSLLSFAQYLTSGGFLESVGENWESEFLQMLAFVYLGCWLVQRGSPESRDADREEEDSDEDPRLHRDDPDAPWPVRRGGILLVLYEHSLGIAFLVLFLIGFGLHAAGGLEHYNEEQLEHGEAIVTLAQYLGTPRFWFESFQNWQSEFLAVAALIYLTVYLRQRGSPQSKPVATPHAESGE
jgi:hypothetical protein